MTRFALTAFLVLASIAGLRPDAARGGDRIVVTDIAGRSVTIERPAKRIILGEGRQLLALALLHPDPVSMLAGWPGDLKRQDEATYELYRKRFPGLDAVPLIGRGSVDTFSIEQALAAAPDVAILSGGYGPSVQSTEIVSRLEAAGVAVVFIDFIAKPLENTLPSIRILGRILGREPEADAYAAFYKSRMDRIAGRLAESRPNLPSVLMHAHAGLGDCCNSPARATIGAFIDAAGGVNIAADVLKQPFGQLNPEYVIERDPDIYVGTGGVHLIGKGGLVMGPAIAEGTAREALAAVVRHPVLAGLRAVSEERVYGIWHIFNNLPMNFLAVEALARWFHPALFADVDPDESLRTLNERFLPVPLEGIYWISLK